MIMNNEPRENHRITLIAINCFFKNNKVIILLFKSTVLCPDL